MMSRRLLFAVVVATAFVSVQQASAETTATAKINLSELPSGTISYKSSWTGSANNDSLVFNLKNVTDGWSYMFDALLSSSSKFTVSLYAKSGGNGWNELDSESVTTYKQGNTWYAHVTGTLANLSAALSEKLKLTVTLIHPGQGGEPFLAAKGASFTSVASTASGLSVPGPIAGAGIPALLGLLGFTAWRRRQKAA